ncbi:MAG: FkbM family methyltransferase [Gammaproteobacteria bacterium]
MELLRAEKCDDLVYDVGMHRGEDTQLYLAKGFRVIAFEANPDLVAACRERFAEYIADQRLTIVEGAIMNDTTEKTVTFYQNPVATIWGTTDKKWAERNERMGWASEKVTVDVVDFSNCITKYGMPYYLKIDIEGADMDCLATLGKFNCRPDFVSIESNKISMEGIQGELELLTGLGYDRFKAVQQGTVGQQKIYDPPLEGTAPAKVIARDSSGLFGRELPGNWADVGKITGTYRWIMKGYKILGNDSFVRRNPITRKLWKLSQKIFKRPLPGWYDTHAAHSSVIELR